MNVQHDKDIYSVVDSLCSIALEICHQTISANCHLLAVPYFWLNTYGCRAFSVAGPMAWNLLPYFIRDPTSSTDYFRHILKSYLFAQY